MVTCFCYLFDEIWNILYVWRGSSLTEGKFRVKAWFNHLWPNFSNILYVKQAFQLRSHITLDFTVLTSQNSNEECTWTKIVLHRMIDRLLAPYKPEENGQGKWHLPSYPTLFHIILSSLFIFGQVWPVQHNITAWCLLFTLHSQGHSELLCVTYC